MTYAAHGLSDWFAKRITAWPRSLRWPWFKSSLLLEDLAIKYRTDKQMLNGHGYTQFYARYFDAIKDENFNFLELGVRQGWSMKMWADYFQNCEIWGIDNNIEGLCPKYFDNPRIHFKIGSQDDYEFLSEVSQEAKGFRVIIDDCSHVSPLSIKSFECLFPKLQSGGIYAIEDLHVCNVDPYIPYGPSVIDYVNSLSWEQWGIINIELIENKICFIRKK